MHFKFVYSSALTKTSTYGLFIFFLMFCNGFLLIFFSEKVELSFAQSTLNTTSISAKSKNFNIRVGQGNSTISYNQYYPSNIEIVKGESITWYSGTDMPLPHTVTFIYNSTHKEKIATPFYVSNSTQFVPEVENIGQPLNKTYRNGTEIVTVLNSRALNPTVITNDSKVLNLAPDATYIFKGNEKFVNSGPLLSLDEKQNFDYSFSNSFTLVFDKPGLYNYSCLFHPWMIGKVLVKPK
jgi:plastocyanin